MPYRRGGRDAGQVAIEYLGFIPILLIVAMAGIQIGVVAYAAEQASTAARAGARAASLQQDPQPACAQAVSGALTVKCGKGPADAGSVTVTARVKIPKIIWDFGDATKTATMPLDH
ncbi:septum formation initiator [Streptomyces fodineus]|uniref:Septum formation initiator n=1 Tax=Streptomyces fodineus TaxID=1904616 RepID=A0A1D7Y9S1_9ACTN|nr:TadE/TadG family type IV pilus assembly protein [Streptomyces fodineus]AOR32377.1 septum formation initiator [Streptomyces fodineus]